MNKEINIEEKKVNVKWDTEYILILKDNNNEKARLRYRVIEKYVYVLDIIYNCKNRYKVYSILIGELVYKLGNDHNIEINKGLLGSEYTPILQALKFRSDGIRVMRTNTYAIELKDRIEFMMTKYLDYDIDMSPRKYNRYSKIRTAAGKRIGKKRKLTKEEYELALVDAYEEILRLREGNVEEIF